jgi:hypothetical protein
VVGDPALEVYRTYRIESSLLHLLLSIAKPSFYGDWMRAMRYGYWGTMHTRMMTMPADFLIGPDQRIRLVHYGRDIGDHMAVSTILGSL